MKNPIARDALSTDRRTRQNLWIVAADASRARIFEASNSIASLREIETFQNPEGRASNRELTSDAEGRYFSQGGGPQAHTATPRIDAVQHDVAMFAKTLGEYLDKARIEHRYDKLHIIAPPKFLGLLRAKMSKEAHQLVESEVGKDLSQLDANAIKSYLTRE